ncbi:MAG: DUF4093 domain-containing protein, partial [Clostridia bacterium]|nr:DUF4093 domain-containing protein [Clostridia bacterium]
MKPRCSKVIIVEGKYDKIRLESLLDATVITTEGFGIFKNTEKRALLKRLAEKKGLVILSDPDGAGKVIRGHLHTLTGGRGITDLYVPPVLGKERRKNQSSKEGLLGVEGIDNQTILSLFEKSGLLDGNEIAPPTYTKTDLYRLGYFGKDDSKSRREAVLEANALPKN